MRDIGREQLLNELRALKPELERAGVTHLALFGSRARDDNRSDSDVDVIVEIDDRRKFSMLDLVGVGHTIGDRLNIETNVLTRRSLDVDFEAGIRPDLIEIF